LIKKVSVSELILSAPATVDSGLRPLPGARRLPLVGETLQYTRDPIGWARERYDRYGPVSWTSLFGVKTVAVPAPDAVETALRNRDKALSSE
jgi:hypothetical protein